jgi:hypothetical protein
MVLRYTEILGTGASDVITDGCGYVTLGLQGNDTINGIVGDNQLCIGGTGSNVYNLIQSDIMTIVSVNGANELVVAPDINLKASTTYWGLVNNKSLFFLDSTSGEAAIVVNDYRTDQISETFKLAGTTYSYQDILSLAQTGSGQSVYIGNVSWDGAFILANGSSVGDNREAWQFYAAKAAAMEGSGPSPTTAQTFISTAANDTFTGGSAVDTVVYAGARSQYQVSTSGGTITVTDSVSGRDGADTLTGVEQLKFSDTTLVFDLTSAQDKLVYEIYQAAYARTPDLNGFRYWAQRADSEGLSGLSLADAFLQAAEFTQKYGANPNNATYVTALYTNVLGRAPDQSGIDYWVGQANGGETRKQLLVDFATSGENVTHITPHISNGFWLA